MLTEIDQSGYGFGGACAAAWPLNWDVRQLFEVWLTPPSAGHAPN
jgi:hypothetical protein